MNVSFSRAAWLGIRLMTDDTDLKIRIDGLLLLSRADRPSCDLPRPVLTAAVEAYRRWSTSHHLMGA